MLSPFQEPGSIQLKPLKESTQAWLTDKKIKVSEILLVCNYSSSLIMIC